MREFKKYVRTNTAEMGDLETNENSLVLKAHGISVSSEDKDLPLNEFMKGKVARNPDNHKDQWYVAKKYVEDNFEIIPAYLLYKYEE